MPARAIAAGEKPRPAAPAAAAGGGGRARAERRGRGAARRAHRRPMAATDKCLARLNKSGGRTAAIKGRPTE
jgi:hypothetical protein